MGLILFTTGAYYVSLCIKHDAYHTNTHACVYLNVVNIFSQLLWLVLKPVGVWNEYCIVKTWTWPIFNLHSWQSTGYLFFELRFWDFLKLDILDIDIANVYMKARQEGISIFISITSYWFFTSSKVLGLLKGYVFTILLMFEWFKEGLWVVHLSPTHRRLLVLAMMVRRRMWLIENRDGKYWKSIAQMVEVDEENYWAMLASD